MLPPFEEHRITDELEPRCELEIGIRKHRLEFLLGNISGIFYFIGIWQVMNIGLDKEYVVDCIQVSAADRSSKGGSCHTFMFTPFTVTGSFVMYSGEKVEIIQRYLLGLDTKLVI